VLWALTNWHVLRVGRAIKADIDLKRLKTETFVADQIGRIERSVADLRGQPQPPVLMEMQEEVGALRRELSDALGQMGTDLGRIYQGVEEIPRQLQIARSQTAAAEQQMFQGHLSKLDSEVAGKMTIQEALASQDPEMVQYAAMKRVAEMKPTDKWVEEHPYGAIFFEAMKSKVMDVASDFGLGAPSSRPRGASVSKGRSSGPPP